VKSILSKTKIGAKSGGRPRAAIELSADGVLGAALDTSGGEPEYSFASLPAGALVPGIAEPMPMPVLLQGALRQHKSR